jgi:hypothetical protein
MGSAARTGLAAALVLTSLACRKSGDTVLVVVVELQTAGNLNAVKLRVEVEDASHDRDGHDFSPPNGMALSFPTDFTLQFVGAVANPLRVDVSALDSQGTVVARGAIADVMVRAGERREARVVLQCVGRCPPALERDAGVAGDGPDSALEPDSGPGTLCGNGDIDPGELCDPGITGARLGACPPASCDDGVACTTDRLVVGEACRLICEHTPIDTRRAGDGCCPAGASSSSDPDCSAACGNQRLDTGERCDTAIPAGHVDACPTVDSCADDDPCTAELLVSAGTCAAVCLHLPILRPGAGDRCCPPGGNIGNDPDCPAACGNRYRDPGETCDVGATGTSAACSSSCDDGIPCTTDVMLGAGCLTKCEHIPVTRAIAGDGCCLPGSHRNVDADCAPRCGNGQFESGETCDSAIAAGLPGACPTSCPSSRACVGRQLDGQIAECSARCVDVVPPCSSTPNGCCVAGCPGDPDCSGSCGNGVVEAGESCDTAIAAGTPGACPTACKDNLPCTADQLVSRGTCQARCDHLPITEVAGGDGCCPPGGNAALDADCPATCGDGVVEGSRGELCDRGLPANDPGACPTACTPLPPGCARVSLTGDPASCTSQCTIDTITSCVSGDACCALGCSAANDSDCHPVCGDGQVDAPETCDRGISAGNPGACLAQCDDQDSCTVDVVLGRSVDCTRTCKHTRIEVCRGDDGCCPRGCTSAQDLDCGPAVCGDRYIQREETCDPMNRCPTVCPEDGDPCTGARLQGDPTRCTSFCTQVPIKTCSGALVDRCCPKDCASTTDADCAGPPARRAP